MYRQWEPRAHRLLSSNCAVLADSCAVVSTASAIDGSDQSSTIVPTKPSTNNSPTHSACSCTIGQPRSSSASWERRLRRVECSPTPLQQPRRPLPTRPRVVIRLEHQQLISLDQILASVEAGRDSVLLDSAGASTAGGCSAPSPPRPRCLPRHRTQKASPSRNQPIATPDRIQFVGVMPKTRSGKIMRRILRKVTEGEPEKCRRRDDAG